MGDTDFSDQFQVLCQKAMDAHKRIESASLRQQTTKVAGTEGRVTDTASHQVKADTGESAVPTRWQEVRDRWRSHVENVNSHIKKAKADLDASDALQNAGTAESYARETIQFARLPSLRMQRFKPYPLAPRPTHSFPDRPVAPTVTVWTSRQHPRPRGWLRWR